MILCAQDRCGENTNRNTRGFMKRSYNRRVVPHSRFLRSFGVHLHC